MICPYCENELIEDTKHRETYCVSCGLVVRGPPEQQTIHVYGVKLG